MNNATNMRRIYTVSKASLRERPAYRKDEDGVLLQIVYNDLPGGDVIIIEYECDETVSEKQVTAESAVMVEEDPVASEADSVAEEDPVVPEADSVAEEDPVAPEAESVAEEDPVTEPVPEKVEIVHAEAIEEVAATPEEKAASHTFPVRRLAAVLLAVFLAGLIAYNAPGLVHAVKTLRGQTVAVDSQKGEISEKRLVGGAGGTSSDTTQPDSQTQSEPSEEPTATPEPIQDFKPHCVKSTRPNKMISMTQVNVNGKNLPSISSYKPKKTISFSYGDEYTDVDGIVTFRGNNFRDNPTYGLADMKKDKLKGLWTYQTGSMNANGRVWSGNGWTGQPLMRRWTRQEKQHMNMYDWAKQKDSLVEVIYASLDGKVYFMDLKTGKATREPLNLGFTFKGAGALDPRGYPILYVGAGYDGPKGKSRVFIVSLIDGKVLYTFGCQDSFSLRGSLSFFDSSALVDASTDTLIYPGENGILYLMRLNSRYNAKTGKVVVKPDRIVKWRYQGKRSSQSKYWLGMEDSCVIYQGYLYIMDNGGHFMCLDLNTLKLVWVQDSLDDSNSTPVLSVEDGKAYLYASTSFHLGWRSSSSAEIPIWKIDAQTGEILWKTKYTCYSEEGVSGGVQSTIAVGKNNLADCIYVTVSKTGSHYGGVLACLNKANGKVMWEHKAGYSWSSPVCVYNKEGTGRVLYCSSDGNMYLLDGRKGKELDSLKISTGCIEASPAVYENIAVVGTRACQIWGIKLQ